MNIERYYEVTGRGAPVVFIHGSYATTSTWRALIKEFSRNHTCISMKLPGHCGTPDPGDFSRPGIETELEILEEIVRLQTDEPVHLVGHSYGGVVALAQALKANLDISQLSLFEPVAIWVLKKAQDVEACATVEKFLLDYRRAVNRNQPFACGKVIDFWGGEGEFETLPDVLKESMQPLVANNIRHWDVLAAVESTVTDLQLCTTPTRLVCGTRSNPVARAICNHLGDLMPNSKKYTIEGASHFLVTSHPHQCAEVLRDQSILRYSL